MAHLHYNAIYLFLTLEYLTQAKLNPQHCGPDLFGRIVTYIMLTNCMGSFATIFPRGGKITFKFYRKLTRTQRCHFGLCLLDETV